MHDIDRTQLEADFESDFEGDFEGDLEADYETDFEGDYEADLEGDYEADLEGDLEGENYESEQFEWGGETGAVLNEADEMELASQLMEVNDEQELDQFLGALIRRAGRALGGLVRSPQGQAIGGILKGAVRQIMPHAATGLGTLVRRAARGAAQQRLALSPSPATALGMESETDGSGEPAVRRRQAVRAGRRGHRQERAGGGPLRGAGGCRASRHRTGGKHTGARIDASTDGATRSRTIGGMSGRWMRRGSNIVLYGV